MVEVMQAMNTQKRIGLFAALAVILLFFIVALYWIFSPQYTTLFSALDDETASQVIKELEAQAIPYHVVIDTQGNLIEVPSAHAEKLRVTLSSTLGLVDVKGLELFDDADYSMTDFSQDVTYKRAIQGELARTISAMPGIKQARVHITFAPKRLFSAEQKDAKAAVYLEAENQSTLANEQVLGIKKLVANTIENLDSDKVSVFDHEGIELAQSDGPTTQSNLDGKYEVKSRMEARLTENAYRLMTLYVAPEDLAISVDVTVNFDQRRLTKQGFATQQDGEGYIVRQRESSVAAESNNKDTPYSKVEPVISQEKETEFRHGQETEETIYSAGRVEKINVGVAIRGELDREQIVKIKQIVSAGLGINEFRGDKLALDVLNIQPRTVLQPKQTNLVPDPPLSDPSQQLSASDTFYAAFASQYSLYWFVAFILIVAVLTLTFTHRRRQTIARREALLVEMQQWLEREVQLDGRA